VLPLTKIQHLRRKTWNRICYIWFTNDKIIACVVLDRWNCSAICNTVPLVELTRLHSLWCQRGDGSLVHRGHVWRSVSSSSRCLTSPSLGVVCRYLASPLLEVGPRCLAFPSWNHHLQITSLPLFGLLVRLSGPPEIWRVVRGQLRSRPLVFVEFAARPIGNRGRLRWISW
jgi:hypothetical protein